jgi:L-alanine-DL-glutamate epimerase-like enolase superfamily enzyme
VTGDGQRLAVDANARFDVPTAFAYAEALAPYDLRWYEDEIRIESGYVRLLLEPGIGVETKLHALLATLLD